MSILFIALPIVEPVEDLFFPLQDGVPGADWHDPGDHHLTLAFLGEVPDHRIVDLAAKLAALRSDQFTLELSGVGHFPPRGKPKVLWAGVAHSEALERLERKVAHAVHELGLPMDERKFAPHITLARLHDSRVAGRLQPAELGYLGS
jgi:2'-5' RNA ligase